MCCGLLHSYEMEKYCETAWSWHPEQSERRDGKEVALTYQVTVDVGCSDIFVFLAAWGANLDFASHYHSFLLEHVGECSCKLCPNLYKLSDLFWESGSWRYMNGERLDESLGIWRKWKLVALLKLERGRPGERKIPDLKQRISNVPIVIR